MQTLNSSSLSFLSISSFIFIFIIVSSPTSFSEEDVYLSLFRNCSSQFSCGKSFPIIGYPFWGGNKSPDCGLDGFNLTCQQGDILTIDIAGQIFRVLSISTTSYALRIARNDLWDDICPENYENRAFDASPFHPGHEVRNITLFYACPADLSAARIPFSCKNVSDNSVRDVFYANNPGCESNITFLALESEVEEFSGNPSVDLLELLHQGFDVEYNLNGSACFPCEISGGLCWSGTNSTEHRCLCSDGVQDNRCLTADRGKNVRMKIGIGVGAGVGGALIMCLVFFIHIRRQKKRNPSPKLLTRDISSDPSSVTDPEMGIGSNGVHIFDYSELEEATNNFDSERELGDGGFGTVYKGKLKDGRDVAVKRLYESNFKRVEHFQNEVVILTGLRHQNLVTLYGCTSRHARELLLVYEYVPNGTVADHLHGELARPGSLPWSTRLKIAIETANALSYLHASKIIHRDVKTNNILLDKNFCVKVADFGLSRLFPINATHISTAPQGTPGYVDPEYHHCYHLTNKSDVFSFGVVLIELISSLPAVDISRHRHEINLSTMAINKIHNRSLHELVDPNLGYESDYNVRMMITDVAELAYQSLQDDREVRPSMKQVVEILLQIQSNDYSAGGNAREIDIQADDVGLLRPHQLTSSPNSDIEGWASTSSTATSNTSN